MNRGTCFQINETKYFERFHIFFGRVMNSVFIYCPCPVARVFFFLLCIRSPHKIRNCITCLSIVEIHHFPTFILSIFFSISKQSVGSVHCFSAEAKPFNYHQFLFLYKSTHSITLPTTKWKKKKRTFVIGCSCQTAYVNWSQTNGSHFGSFALSVLFTTEHASLKSLIYNFYPTHCAFSKWLSNAKRIE